MHGPMNVKEPDMCSCHAMCCQELRANCTTERIASDDF